MAVRLPFRLPARGPGDLKPVVPDDPARVLEAPIDRSLLSIRSGLVPHRRRLWIRRIARRTWIALAVVAVAELVLWGIARVTPVEQAPVIAVSIPVVVLMGLLAAVIHA
ncbi:MAG TPA: hypothetical protein VLA76_11895, partial [Candidatus Angelobacter sp.]|nr:hypothetical protein [Candidatus Angelobacter sp.]